MWKDKSALKTAIQWGIDNTDILKISDEDLKYLTIENPEQYFEQPQLILHSRGKDGANIYYKDDKTKSLMKISSTVENNLNVIDTTGAGDIFTGAFLSKLIPYMKKNSSSDVMLQKSSLSSYLANKNTDQIRESLIFANQIAGISVETKGGIPSIPCKETWKTKYL